jgi:hypothetical protein
MCGGGAASAGPHQARVVNQLPGDLSNRLTTRTVALSLRKSAVGLGRDRRLLKLGFFGRSAGGNLLAHHSKIFHARFAGVSDVDRADIPNRPNEG